MELALVHILVKYLGEDRDKVPLAGTVAICFPWDLLIGHRFICCRLAQKLHDAYANLCTVLKSAGDVCAIVYCIEGTTCDDLSTHFSRNGIPFAVYHAGPTTKLRSSVLDGWISSKILVVVATVAFGVGIDRKNATDYLESTWSLKLPNFQMWVLSGFNLQISYGVLGSWSAYIISALYVEYRSRKEKANVSFKNHVILWFEVLADLLESHWKAAGFSFSGIFLLIGFVIQLIICASHIYYINDKLDKRTWTFIFGVGCASTMFIPSFHNYRIWFFLDRRMIKRGNYAVTEVLVQRSSFSPEDSTWEAGLTFSRSIPTFILEDKNVLQEGSIDTSLIYFDGLMH